MEKLTDQLRRAVLKSENSLKQISRDTGIDAGNLSRFTRGEAGLSEAATDRLFAYLGLRVVGPLKKRGK
jgi:hypothetical protein